MTHLSSISKIKPRFDFIAGARLSPALCHSGMLLADATRDPFFAHRDRAVPLAESARLFASLSRPALPCAALRRSRLLAPLALAPAYTERVRGASRRLFFRRHFEFHISNLKFLPALRSNATAALACPVKHPARASRDSVSPNSPSGPNTPVGAFRPKSQAPRPFFPRALFSIFPFPFSNLDSASIPDSSARHKKLPRPHGPGCFSFVEFVQKALFYPLFVSFNISRDSTLLPKPSRERSKEGITCKEALFVR